MNRRSFIQALGVLAATPALGKYLNLFKSGGVREGITQAIDKGMDKGMDFYNLVIKKVVDEGTMVKEQDRFRTYTHPDRPDISVDVNVGTGDSAVYFDTDQGSKGFAEITSDIEAPKAGKELIEGEEVYKGMGPDGDYYKDVEEGEIRGGLTSLEEWIKMKRGYAAGGRVGMWRGGGVKVGKNIMNLLRNNKKIKEAVDNIFGSGDYKMDAEMAAESLVELNPKVFGGKLYEDLDDGLRSEIYGKVLPEVRKPRGATPKGTYEPETKKQFFKDVDEAGGMENYLNNNPLDDRVKTFDIEKGLNDLDSLNFTRDAEAARIKVKYPGISDDLIKKIMADDNPQRKAEVFATMDEAFKMMEKGMGPNEIIELFKNTTRTKQANGGIIGLTNNITPVSSKAGVETLFERR